MNEQSQTWDFLFEREKDRTVYYPDNKNPGYILDSEAREKKLRSYHTVKTSIMFALIPWLVFEKNVLLFLVLVIAFAFAEHFYHRHLVKDLPRTPDKRKNPPYGLKASERVASTLSKSVACLIAFISAMIVILSGWGCILEIKSITGPFTLSDSNIFSLGVGLFLLFSSLWMSVICLRALRHKVPDDADLRVALPMKIASHFQSRLLSFIFWMTAYFIMGLALLAFAICFYEFHKSGAAFDKSSAFAFSLTLWLFMISLFTENLFRKAFFTKP